MNTAEISWSDFEKVELRAGTILAAEEFPEAKKPAYKLTIDFGELGIRQSSAQLVAHYTRDQLLGEQVIAVVNLPKKQIASIVSECLVTGLIQEDGSVILSKPATKVKNGLRLA